MATWKNLDTLASYSKLNSLKDHVNIAEAMSGEQGAEDRKSTRLNSSHLEQSRMPSSA